MTSLRLTSADGFEFDAYVARPAASAKGAVVVLQEIFGVNSHIREVADRFAASGYLAVAPSTFARVRAGVELGYGEADRAVARQLKDAVESLPEPGVMPDLAATIGWAAKESGAKVGIVGFCWGGLLAWRAACALDGLACAVVYYGGGVTGPTEAAKEPKVPVLGHFGSKDTLIPLPTVEAFAAKQPKVDVHVYPADHGFNCDQRGSYDAASAATAATRTNEFLARHLG